MCTVTPWNLSWRSTRHCYSLAWEHSKGIKVKLLVDPEAVPHFHKACPIPYASKPKVEADYNYKASPQKIAKLCTLQRFSPSRIKVLMVLYKCTYVRIFVHVHTCT